jgi:hypothetical protein
MSKSHESRNPCRTPERILYLFTRDHGSKIFYYRDFADWITRRLGPNQSASEIERLINDTLNLPCIIELGDDAYRSDCRL